ncbi:hypothetical protein GBA63_09815 [Rubrobacter tropicus]|uniref:Uncharacterized protein n=1 Tax=Rubrobacter tropicus TaxID=2653851 RepID=A0A6G8Q908_9ACTN|nr:hypothetical protein [Rubrobacter tropicus]QIN82908.1 hypothetical protein GBA63_09815 [Rubrobacter tropicus]
MKKLLALAATLAMVLTMAAPAMADDFAQDNSGDATVDNYNATDQANYADQHVDQYSEEGDNSSEQSLVQVNYNTSEQIGVAFAGNIAADGF